MKYVNVVIDNVSNHTDVFYTYQCPFDEVRIGSVVKVPFGKGNKQRLAWVFEIPNDDGGIKNIKEVFSHEEEYSLNEDAIKLCVWMRNTYLCRYVDAVKCMIPPGEAAKRGKRADPYSNIEIERDIPPMLTDEQQSVVNRIYELQDRGEYAAVLLNGVTSSGKTEVYLRAVENTLKHEKSAIVLVPEISLTPQTITRFIARFGTETVAVLHSKLTKSQRYDQWMRVKNGGARILIGARSGLFAPFDEIGLIIIDEEHEASYKSDMTPKYDTIDTALTRAKNVGATVILGTATPSIISAYRVSVGEYELLQMKKRYNNTSLPSVEIIDMRKELQRGNRSIFSVSLMERANEVLSSGKQVILFLNRRGYSSFVSCRNCGYVMRCYTCGVSLTYHKSSGMAECHYCGRKIRVPQVCPSCGGKYIKHFGAGTEQVEEFAKELFPNYTVDRLDLDTTARKGEAERILNAFRKGKTNILVGTQLVSKGLDFANVGLVGIVAADISLNIPDYRSAERTFQLIVQSAGRAGRGDEAGHVVIQTYSPEERAILDAAAGDFKNFYKHEIKIRQLTGYPPFTNIIRLIFYGEKEDDVIDDAQGIYNILSAEEFANSYEILSPQPAYMSKLNGDYRYHIIIKSPVNSTERYLNTISELKDTYVKSKNTKTNMLIEIDPYSFS